ncbi:MAG: hypothetical protein NTY67_02560 [Cyanobacteria bacterium]|nr:hypothetical protein [Cyanobacteriota bacterium]
MTFTAESPLREAGPEESPQDDPGDDLQDFVNNKLFPSHLTRL